METELFRVVSHGGGPYFSILDKRTNEYVRSKEGIIFMRTTIASAKKLMDNLQRKAKSIA